MAKKKPGKDATRPSKPTAKDAGKTAPAPAPAPREEYPGLDRPDMPLNIKKILAAIRYKRMEKEGVQDRAGWWPNKIYSWGKNSKPPRLSAEEAWQAAAAIELPVRYIIDDAIPLQEPPPPRAAFEVSTFEDRARMNRLTPEEALDGLRLLGVIKDLEMDHPEVIRLVSSAREERRQYLAQPANGSGSGTTSRPPEHPAPLPSNRPTVSEEGKRRRRGNGNGGARNGGNGGNGNNNGDRKKSGG